MIERAHEWYDQLGQLLRVGPFPGVEFRMLGGEIDVGIGAGEPHRKPFLAIPTIQPAHHPVSNLVRHLVVKPASALGKDHGSTSADLLFQLTQDRLARGFANIDAALRHLPLRQPRRHADTAADKGQAVAVEQHYPYPER